MNDRIHDMSPLVDMTRRRQTGPTRSAHPVYVDLLPPCNNACPAGEDIQGWLQNLATASGYWPLFRFKPMRSSGENPFRLDSPRPRIPLNAYAYNELRYRSLEATRPEEADTLLGMAQVTVAEKYRQYEELASRDGSRFRPA
jgi:pyruvate/2-oxoacid:ferredoxin oxidoreductase beta subunit